MIKRTMGSRVFLLQYLKGVQAIYMMNRYANTEGTLGDLKYLGISHA